MLLDEMTFLRTRIIARVSLNVELFWIPFKIYLTSYCGHKFSILFIKTFDDVYHYVYINLQLATVYNIISIIHQCTKTDICLRRVLP